MSILLREKDLKKLHEEIAYIDSYFMTLFTSGQVENHENEKKIHDDYKTYYKGPNNDLVGSTNI